MLRYLSHLPRPARLLVNGYLFLGLLHFFHGIFDGDVAILLLDETQKIHKSRSMADGAHIWWAGFMANMSAIAVEPYISKILADVRWWDQLNLAQVESGLPTVTRETHNTTFRTFHPYFRRVLPAEYDKSWHHWLFLNNEPEDDAMASKWHDAFSELIQHHHRHPASNNAQFHAVHCGLDPSLCTQWGTPWPAFVHFTTDQGNNSKYRIEKDGVLYDKVAARVIKLPLSASRMHLPPGSFPSPLNQLKSLTHNPEEWNNHEPVPDMHELSRLEARLHQDAIAKNPLTYGPLDWIVDTLVPALLPAWLPGSLLLRIPFNFAEFAGYTTITIKKTIHNDMPLDLQRRPGTTSAKPPSLNVNDGSAFRWMAARAADWFGCMGEDNVKQIRTIQGMESVLWDLGRLMIVGKNGTDPGGGLRVHTGKHQEKVWHRCFRLDD